MQDERRGNESISLEEAVAELRYSLRTFTRTPVVYVALLLTIAIGIGANAVVYSLGRGVFQRDTPATREKGIVSLVARHENQGADPVSYEDFQWLERHTDALEWVGAALEYRATVEHDERSDVVAAAAVTEPLAALLQLTFREGVVMRGEASRLLFGTRPPNDKRVRVDGRELRVRAITPAWLEGLHVGQPVDVWLEASGRELQAAGQRGQRLWVIAKLKPGVALADMQAIVRARRSGDRTFDLVRFTGLPPGIAEGLQNVHLLLAAAAAGVLLMGGATLASSFLSRSAARSRESAIRVALGARRRQVLARLVADVVVIIVPGIALGILVAYWTSRIVPAMLVEGDARAVVFKPHLGGLVTTCVLAGLGMIACGLAPLRRARFERPETVLRRASMGMTKTSSRLHSVLVAAQVAICCALVIATGFLIGALRRDIRTPAGRNLGDVVLATVQSSSDGTRYFDRVDSVLHAVTGDSSAAWVARPPGSLPSWQNFRIEPVTTSFRRETFDVRVFGPQTLQEIALPPVRGRLFGGADRPGGCLAAVVNRVAADRFFSGNAVGARVLTSPGKSLHIVGVVVPRDSNDRILVNEPVIYLSEYQVSEVVPSVGAREFLVPDVHVRDTTMLDVNAVSTGYFAGVGAPLVAGVNFDPRPAWDGCRVGVVDVSAAERFFGGKAVGSTLIDPAGRRIEIVGVVRPQALGRFERGSEPTLYLHMNQTNARRMARLVNGVPTSDAGLGALRKRIDQVDGRRASPVVERLNDHLGRTALAPLRIALILLRAGTVLGFVLAIVGVYGALTDAVHRRQREIGLRLALGSRRRRVALLVFGHAYFVTGAGALVGMAVGFLLSSPLRSFMPGVGGAEWQAWLAAPLVMLAVVTFASIVPVRRAVTVSPLTVLKADA